MIRLTWTATGDDGLEGTAASYDIRHSTQPLTDLNWDQATQVEGEPKPKPSGSTEKHTIRGLEPATTYYVGIRAVDEGGNEAELSNVVSKTTNQKMSE